jgi:hypothetical protein
LRANAAYFGFKGCARGIKNIFDDFFSDFVFAERKGCYNFFFTGE